MRNINNKTADLLLEIGLEVNKTSKPVTIAKLCKKLVTNGSIRNKSTVYGRVEILVREGYVKKFQASGEKDKVVPTIKGWRELGEEYDVDISDEGIMIEVGKYAERDGDALEKGVIEMPQGTIVSETELTKKKGNHSKTVFKVTLKSFEYEEELFSDRSIDVIVDRLKEIKNLEDKYYLCIEEVATI